MDIRTSFAAQSYTNARPLTAPDADGAGPVDPGAKLAASFVDTLQAGEAAARTTMISGADPNALVQALAATELAVETAVTVRDRVVEAYQEILRMPV